MISLLFLNPHWIKTKSVHLGKHFTAFICWNEWQSEKNRMQCICRLQHEVTLERNGWIDDIRHFIWHACTMPTEKMNWQESCRCCECYRLPIYMWLCTRDRANVGNSPSFTCSFIHIIHFLSHIACELSAFVRNIDTNNRDNRAKGKKKTSMLLLCHHSHYVLSLIFFLNAIEIFLCVYICRFICTFSCQRKRTMRKVLQYLCECVCVFFSMPKCKQK